MCLHNKHHIVFSGWCVCLHNEHHIIFSGPLHCSAGQPVRTYVFTTHMHVVSQTGESVPPVEGPRAGAVLIVMLHIHNTCFQWAHSDLRIQFLKMKV